VHVTGGAAQRRPGEQPYGTNPPWASDETSVVVTYAQGETSPSDLTSEDNPGIQNQCEQIFNKYTQNQYKSQKNDQQKHYTQQSSSASKTPDHLPRHQQSDDNNNTRDRHRSTQPNSHSRSQSRSRDRKNKNSMTQ